MYGVGGVQYGPHIGGGVMPVQGGRPFMVMRPVAEVKGVIVLQSNAQGRSSSCGICALVFMGVVLIVIGIVFQSKFGFGYPMFGMGGFMFLVAFVIFLTQHHSSDRLDAVGEATVPQLPPALSLMTPPHDQYDTPKVDQALLRGGAHRGAAEPSAPPAYDSSM